MAVLDYWVYFDSVSDNSSQNLTFFSKEEYMSKVGLAMLLDHSGGHITAEMRDIIAKQKVDSPLGRKLLAEVKEKWDDLDAREEGEKVNF